MSRRVDIEFTRSGGVAGIVLHGRLTDVALSEDEEAMLMTPAPPAPAELPVDRFVYDIVMHADREEHRVQWSEPDLDDRTRPLVDRLAELVRGTPSSC